MRISDWSSDVCSSDLVDIGFDVARGTGIAVPIPDAANVTRLVDDPKVVDARLHEFDRGLQAAPAAADDSDFDILRNGGARRLRRVRSEERRVGQAGVSPCRSRGSPSL